MTAVSETTTERAPGSVFTEATVQAAGFTVRYAEAGTGEPVVVLHGAGGLRHSVALDLLAERHRVVQIEMPGFGDQPNTVHQTPGELADAVAQTIAAIGIERYHLLGTSFGGAIAVHLALGHPDGVISLVLEGPASFREGATSPADASPEELMRRFRVYPERQPAFTPPDPQYMARTWPLVERLLGSRPAYDQELADRLPELTVRTLVVFGNRDGIIPSENGAVWRRLLPKGWLVLVHNAAHDIQGDRPEAFVEVVQDWLARGWEFLIPDTPSILNP
jgi:pimeloyl-ACP methyl ester carboxylesterase